ncbi:molybdate ABC transporter substrate-binding protein [Psychromonas aquimarina]|uniref:molybdate ABC transporter substrate-binding protein n=1 Tax=Psychromonas aquimarina TaxID=444919 RepID=UPI0004260681|nr:molybdate ABC transporter substrate-binding protein [Psychromonas aquimarina]
MKLLTVLLLIFVMPLHASIKVAVASNFKTTLNEIALRYQQLSGDKVIISSASTGTLFNQIRHGAPFDLFLSADSERAVLIEDSKYGVKGSRFTYAQGRLAFWLPQGEKVNQQTLLDFSGRLAIANPKLAPYGLASKQTLKQLNLWQRFSYIKGANIAQTYQFIDSGNINAGFVAYSLLLQNNKQHYYLIPDNLHQPILQQGVLLTAAADNKKVLNFINYLKSETTQAFIREKGYL